ncbi:MAG: hypothetical protein H0V01_15780 [Bacteroidetes bacterium]|nr:hypothetical protein [Bacteroidota bacterium]HET6244236.1 hypothetical protein [Bacteroidia bacterium]
MKKLFFCIFFFLLLTHVQAQNGQTWMFGPMVHVNFGGEKTSVSYALEFSYWNYRSFPYSFDFAFELEKGKMRIYSEAQTGVGFAGIAAGPVLEYSSIAQKLNLGFQGSVWGNYFWGFDMRVRNVGGETYFSPGTYLKLPTAIFTSEFYENNNSSGWDWD